ncbi:prolyl oligopeptidase family serine peptidase [bacterium]|nr:prolyl oligopeptidase family serine peptidase [bacterium]
MRNLLAILLPLLLIQPLAAQTNKTGDEMVHAYFADQTAKVAASPLNDIENLEQWQAKRDELKQQFQEMLGLEPMPEKTDLMVTTTGTVERDGVVVENLHFQSRPGLYVTGNLYRPAKVEGKLPAILYVCGHGRVKKDGISYGNKTHYQHHGAWFARHGFICLTIDSIQLGEIEGKHRGSYDDSGQWWTNRGYTPAGVETWNCVRAIDLLQARDDVDPERIGVTGRSGGGAYSWYIAALDDRIKVAVPVAGITDLEDHVVNGIVSGHCDCMYWVNTYQFDYPLLPALIAPRPLMIANTDRDPIFPLLGVQRTHQAARKIYELYGKAPNLALTILPGLHADTQPLRVPAFYWLQMHLQGDTPLIDMPATALFKVEELKVFDEIPKDEIVTSIEESFVPLAKPAAVPESEAQWRQMASHWKKQLSEKSLRAWPKEPTTPTATKKATPTETDDWLVTEWTLTTQPNAELPLLEFQAKAPTSEQTQLQAKLVIADDQQWDAWQAAANGKSPLPETAETADTIFVLAPRGIGPTQWNQDKKTDIHIRRRYLLLGQSLDAMRMWDICQAARFITESSKAKRVDVEASGNLAALAVYAAIFEPAIGNLTLHQPPADHRDGPYLLNVRRFMNLPEAAAIATNDADAPRSIWTDNSALAEYANQVKTKLKPPAK